MTAFLLSLAEVGGVLLLISAIGWIGAAALFPGGRSFRAERLGWGFTLGCALLAAMVPISFVLGPAPGWIPFLILAGILLSAARLLPLRPQEGGLLPPLPGGARGVAFGCGGRFATSSRESSKTKEEDGAPAATEGRSSRSERPAEGLVEGSTTSRIFLALLLLGIALYTLRALAEPMWSNDYLAIWGFKGKTIFGTHALPERLFRWKALGFSHPEYPLGLPFLYAGVAFLMGHWDDHAMALLFPFFQVATLLVLFGWLRRRGVPWPLPLAAAALLALFEPLYSGFLTGLAEVPLACGMLLFGTAFADALEPTDQRAEGRLAAASLLIAATKNEGLFLAVVAALVAGILMARRKSFRWTVLCAALLPALAATLLQRNTLGNLSELRDFDLSLLAPEGIEELLGRGGESFHTALVAVVLPAWPGLLCVAALLAAGRRTPYAERLLILVAACLAAYVFLPAFSVHNPAWVVRTTLARTAAALAPLAVAGITARLSGLSGLFPAPPGEREA
jgi:hypothetical protein